MIHHISYEQFKALYLQRVAQKFPARIATQTDRKIQLRYHAFNLGFGRLLDQTLKDSGFDDLYGPLVEMSPHPVHAVTPEDFIGALCHPGEGLIVSVNGTDRVWNLGTELPQNDQYAWPFAVTEERCVRQRGHRYRKSIADVASWNCALISVNVESLRAIRQGIVTGRLEVISITGSTGHAQVLVRVRAPSHRQWSAACRGLKDTLHNLGVPIPAIHLRVNMLIPPDFISHRLAYFSPSAF